MQGSKSPYSFVVAFALVAMSGCGGSSSHSTGPTPTQNFNTGVTDLNTALANTGPLDTTDITNAANSFQSSYNAQTSGKAATGLVVCEAALDSNAIASEFTPAAKQNISTAPLLLRSASSLIFWKQAKFSMVNIPKLASPFEFLPTNILSGKKTTSSAATRTVTYTQVLAAVQQVDADLTTLLTYLTTSNIQALESDPLIIIVPVPNSSGTNTLTSVKVGAAEGYALRATIKSLKGVTDMLLAYNLNPGQFDFSESFATLFSSQLVSGAAIAPSAYLPSSFLTLVSAARVKDFGSQWIGAGSDLGSSLSTIQTRMSTKSTGFVTDVYLASTGDYTSANVTAGQGYVNQFEDALTQTQNLTVTNANGDTASITVNAQAWIGTNGTPPANLQKFLPSLTGSLDTNNDMTLSPVAGSIADPTYGGLITGIPTGSPILYDRTLFYSDVVDNPVSDATVAAQAADPLD